MQIPKLNSSEGQTLLACVSIISLALVACVYLWTRADKYSMMKRDNGTIEEVYRLNKNTGEMWNVWQTSANPVEFDN